MQAVSPELKTGVASARAIEGNKTTPMNIKAIIAHGFLGLWSGILIFIYPIDLQKAMGPVRRCFLNLKIKGSK